MNKYLNLFAFCKVIQGNEHSIICDFQKYSIKYIPNSMVEVINMLDITDFESVKKAFAEDEKTFNSYVKYLITEKFAFFSDEKLLYPPLNNSWSSPETINNSIIEYDFREFDIYNLINQLDEMNCKFIEFRFMSIDEISYEKIRKILEFCDELCLRSIRIFVPFENNIISRQVYHKFKKFKKVEVIVFYDAPRTTTTYNTHNVLFTRENMETIRSSNFTSKNVIIDLDYYLEAQNYNPYYNKKVAIDMYGNIKNCLKNNQIFGCIQNNSLSDIIHTDKFKQLWRASHNKILGLRDDEMRFNKLVSNDLKIINENLYEIVG